MRLPTTPNYKVSENVHLEKIRSQTNLTVLIILYFANTPPTHSNQFQLFHDSKRQQYGYVNHSLFYRIYCIFRRIYIIKNNCNFNLIYRYSLTVNI
jgi:hypothetical protein